jgi:hypothetical protein
MGTLEAGHLEPVISFRGEDPGAAFDREIAFHVETLTEANIAQGMQ